MEDNERRIVSETTRIAPGHEVCYRGPVADAAMQAGAAGVVLGGIGVVYKGAEAYVSEMGKALGKKHADAYINPPQEEPRG